MCVSQNIFKNKTLTHSSYSGIVEEVKLGKLSLVDLAGSERAAATDNRGQVDGGLWAIVDCRL